VRTTLLVEQEPLVSPSFKTRLKHKVYMQDHLL
jgi:hypothetical protein